MRDDLLYACSPRWLEESGLPEEIVSRVGEAGWSVLKKLFELETEQNFFPDWFLVSREDLVRWTGALSGRIDEVIECLQQEGYLEIKEGVTPGGLERFRFMEPLLSDEEAEQTKARLKARGYVGVAHLALRYVDAMPAKDKFRSVRHLYEQVFGLRMNTRIADDLREITERFDLALILNAFEEMRRKPNKSLSGLITALYRGERHEEHKTDR